MKTITQTEDKIPLAYVVRCESVGNPDFGEIESLPKSIPADIPCSTLRECVQACIDYINAWDLGGGNWTGGLILHPTKGAVARVSYNGRVWKYTGKKIKVQNLGGRIIEVDDFRNAEEITEGLDDIIK